MLLYDGILRLENSKVKTKRYDIATVVVAKNLHNMETTCSSIISSVRTWLQKAGLQLAEHKTNKIHMLQSFGTTQQNGVVLRMKT